MVHPAEAPFTGFVFKIQANMDPKHRDRIAFFRVCSGRYQPGIKVQHARIEREMKIGNALTFGGRVPHIYHDPGGDQYACELMRASERWARTST